MLAINLEKLPSYQIGNTEGAHKQALAIAAKLLADGKEPARIASITDLPQTEVEQLQTRQTVQQVPSPTGRV